MPSMNWQLVATEQFERDAKRYAKKQRNEFLAVMENLEKYYISIELSSHPKLVQFGSSTKNPRGLEPSINPEECLNLAKNEGNYVKLGSILMPIWNYRHCISFALGIKQLRRRIFVTLRAW